MSGAPRVRRSGVLTDLALGMRMGVGGGRAGWARLALIASGVGVGVAVLLLVASLPTVVDGRTARADARAVVAAQGEGPAAGTLTDVVRSGFRQHGIEGLLLQVDGPGAPLPPGVDRPLAPGEVVVSPALARLMDGPGGEVLRDRWGDAVVGTIGAEGLLGPHELRFYAGTDRLTEGTATRAAAFGRAAAAPVDTDPAMLLLGLVGLVVVLVPVAGFLGTAVRYGGEARDRRLAALRLVGADQATTRRVAAGETLVGAALGLAVGTVLFLVARGVVPAVVPASLTFPATDVRPVPLLAAAVVGGVLLASALVTQSALRRVVVEPLGVVRRASVTRRRLWWRLAVPVAGLALLRPLVGGGGVTAGDEVMVFAGLVLVLVGVALLLPWAVEVVVRRLRPGGVAWDLAVRRLQLESGPAVRAVSTVMVSVAGLIAFHGVVTGMSASMEHEQDVRAAAYQAELVEPYGEPLGHDWPALLAGTPGVAAVDVEHMLAAHDVTTDEPLHVDVGSCAVAAQKLGPVDCVDGDVLVVVPPGAQAPEPGTTYVLGEPGSGASTWTLPADATTVAEPDDPLAPEAVTPGTLPAWVFVTPSALGDAVVVPAFSPVHVALDPQASDAVDHLRTAVAHVDPTVYVASHHQESLRSGFDTVRQLALVGTVALLVVVGASLLVTTAEQLRERRRPLAVLMAFGTRRRTLALSVLWQVAVPMALGLLIAVVTGAGLSIALQVGTRTPVTVDWTGIGTTAGGAALVVLLTTAAGLPLLTRLTAPATLQAE